MPNQTRIAGVLDYPNLLNLLKTGYPELWSESSLTWQTYKNPAGKAINRIAEGSASIIANAAAIAVPLQYRGALYTGYRVQDVITAAEARGKGLFSKLLGLIDDDIRGAQACPNITFPNENSHRFFIRNGWKILCRVPLWEKEILDTASFPLDKAFNYRPLMRFGDEDKAILDAYQKGFEFSLNLDTEYLNWRFFLHPNANYDAFRISSGDASAILVLKRYQDIANNLNRGHICLVAFDNSSPEFLHQILQFADYHFAARACRLVSLWCPLVSPFAGALEQSAYRNVKDLERYALVDQDIPTSGYDLQMCYSDVY
ncbi:MAG: hypothetical protein C9356_03885 [Oleiphilus sp.]|nr:MAG: hypothetical protein C9356_03885 [Oleiphilus sp.]